MITVNDIEKNQSTLVPAVLKPSKHTRKKSKSKHIIANYPKPWIQMTYAEKARWVMENRVEKAPFPIAGQNPE